MKKDLMTLSKTLRYVPLALLALFACKSEPPVASRLATAEARMQQLQLSATVQQQKSYPRLPSASGIELLDSTYYVVGDDAPYVYLLDGQFNQTGKIALFDTADFATGRIPKAVKPDLESIAHFTYGRAHMLLIPGSGSGPKRNRAFLVNLTDKKYVEELDFTRFYTFLKRVLRLEADGELNLEGFAMDNTYTYMLQRALGTSTNVLLRFDTQDFKRFIFGKGDLPAVAVYHFALPAVGGYKTGFSGAFALEDKLFFTASAEDTPNAVADGEVLGSIVGVIDLNALPYATRAASPLQVPAVQFMNPDGTVYKGKAESLVVKAGAAEGMYEVVVVSDDDAGGSGLLTLQLELKL
ncbi:hypothetical protein MKJ04_12060 [Pontibacter sp. E15-1]|uniref:DUF6929 family protein n=1 Tax=Pontibacter sp. E15-1 TaxID=2919918 RepID=UPI001F503EF4|nr:hypothetical protein [Pontibacter sp. E15-1]MCJ8165576.1 hypothetical protein [Pontibacter sp. E15-1]